VLPHGAVAIGECELKKRKAACRGSPKKERISQSKRQEEKSKAGSTRKEIGEDELLVRQALW
jgi:hypothetical protein